MPDNLFANVTDPNTTKESVKPADAPKTDEEIKEGNTTAPVPAPPTPTAPVAPKLNLAPVPEDDEDKPDELSMLKQRANMMGISYSNDISLDDLRLKVKNKMEGIDDEKPAVENKEADAPAISPKVKKANLRQYMVESQMKLVRIRVTNLDPKKKDMPGEVFTVANEYLGSVRKFIPYGEQTDNGYHVPYCLYQQLIDRKFLSIKVTKKNGKEHVETQWAREFAIEVLPQLTETELAQLANAQRAAGSVE